MIKKKSFFNSKSFYVTIAGVVLATAAFGVFQHVEKRRYMRTLNASYLNTFQSAAASAEELAKLFTEAVIVNRPEQQALIFTDIRRHADTVQKGLSSLPYSSETLADTARYMAQTGDFSHSIVKKLVSGNDMDNEDLERLSLLSGYARTLADELSVLTLRLNMGEEIDWVNVLAEQAGSRLSEKDGEFRGQSLLGSLSAVADDFEEYPDIVYDGRYSLHLAAREPKMTVGREAVSALEGEEIVKAFLGIDALVDIRFLSETDIGDNRMIPTLSYAVSLKDDPAKTVYIDITKYGGIPLWFLAESDYSGKNVPVSRDEAETIAADFLEKRGLDNMRPVNGEIHEGTIVFDFTPVVSGVIIYPDLVKIKISLGSGDVLGFEASNFIYNHEERDVPAQIIPESEALTALSDEFLVIQARKCLILLDSGDDAYCYEFAGSYNNSEHSAFINMENGKIERIVTE